jgi:hypothetical protein
MPCTDRQLVQSQLADGFSTRVGVQKAIRPFTGQPEGSNLMDYLNREVFPVLKAAREKVNDMHNVVDQSAPSANPLRYEFAVSTVNGDPTSGVIRLDQAVQNTSATMRVSKINARLKDASVWLDVMAGSATSPLGVVTLSDSRDPGRFIRADLTSMTDRGTWWDLAITPTESSHPNPFVEGESVAIGFIAGVASGTIGPATSIPGIRGISAGTQLLTSGTLRFSNTNGVSFGLTGQTLTASIATSLTAINVSAGTTSNNLSRLTVADNKNVSFGLAGSVLTAFAPIQISAFGTSKQGSRLQLSDGNGFSWSLDTAGLSDVILLGASAIQLGGINAGGTSNTLGTIFLQDAGGITWSASRAGGQFSITGSIATSLTAIRVSAGTTSNLLSAITFSNSNNVSFGLNGSTLTASATVPLSIAGVSALNFGGSISSGSLVFSNDTLYTNFTSAVKIQNVLFSLNGSSIQATAVAGFADSLGAFIATQLSFSNANGITWGLVSSNDVANGRIVIATASAPPTIGLVSHIGGNAVSSVTRLAFSNASNVTWSLSTAANAATVIASVAAGGGGGMGISAGTQSVSTGTMVLSNSNNVSFGMSGSSRITGSFALRASAGASSADVSNLVFTNTNNVGFALSTDANGGTVRAAASINFSAGTTSGNLSNLVFSNSNGVSFGLNGSTITGSVAAAAAGGVAIADLYGHTISNSTVVFDPGANSTLSNVWSGGTLSQNVMFGLTGSTMTAQAHFRVSDDTAGSGFAATRLNFINSNGLRWGATTAVAATDRHINMTATIDYSAVVPNMAFLRNWGDEASLFLDAIALSRGRCVVINNLLPMPGNMTIDTLEIAVGNALNFASTSNSGSFAVTFRGGLYSLNNSTRLSLANSFSSTFSNNTVATSVVTGSRNSSYAGQRFYPILTSNWSANPVLSAGVQYWMYLAVSNAGLPVVAGIMAWRDASAMQGVFADTNSTGAARFYAFVGEASITSIPPTLANSQLTLSAVAGDCRNVAMRFRQGIGVS